MMVQLADVRLGRRERRPEGSVVDVGGVVIGGRRIVVMAGPCSVESADQLRASARAVQAAGGRILRGGAYKPRTSPYSFRGLREEGLEILAQVRRELSIPVVTEVMDARHLESVIAHADMLQIGSRNMQNFTLLEEVGRVRVPVLLKRGLSSTLQELLLASEYVASGGNERIVLCERGIRTFETATRNTLDLNAVPVLKRACHYPVIVDPSHGTGFWWMVPDLARAAVAAGADGLIVEVHVEPEKSLSDAEQTLRPDRFATMMEELRRVAAAIGREL